MKSYAVKSQCCREYADVELAPQKGSASFRGAHVCCAIKVALQ